MDGFILLAILIGLLFAVAVPVAAFVGLSRTKTLRAEVGRLRGRLAAVEAFLREEPDAQEGEAIQAAPPPQAEPEPDPVHAPEPTRQPELRESDWLPIPTSAPISGERMLAERWLVWVGGIALALGGAFLVKFSVDQGLLGPAVRVTLGALAGIAAVGVGHWLSRRPLPSSTIPWHVPPVLVGAGAAMVFASLYAAYGLYDLIPPTVAFAALAATASATVLLSLGHGPFVAMLGLAGAFVVPLLVRSTEPNALGLFTYLLALSAGAVALLRWRGWWWLAWMVLGGASAWTLIWLATAFQSGDEIVLGMFVAALTGLFAAFRLGIPAIPALAGAIDAPSIRQVVAAAGVTVAVLAVVIIHAADFSASALALLFALGAGLLAFGRADQVFDRLPLAAVAATLWVLADWGGGLPALDRFDAVLAPPLPEGIERFTMVAAVAATLYGAVGFVLAWGSRHPVRWAALSAAMPVLTLALAYWRLSPLRVEWGWTAAALALACVLMVAAERVNRHRAVAGMEAALGAYAVGVVAALGLAATTALEEAWLTVALALILAGAAWVDTRLKVDGLRKVALALAAIVLVRLGLNPYILDYPIGEQPVFNWLIYGYGLPALSFAFAASRFRLSVDDILVQVLEAGTIVFAVLLVSLEIRHLMAGGLEPARGYSLAERSLNTVAWLSGAAILFMVHRRNGRRVPLVGGLALLWGASLHAVLLQMLAGNPLLTGDPVGETPILNVLLLAFAAPALLWALVIQVAPPRPELRSICGPLALAFAFGWIGLEVRHAFAGEVLTAGRVGQAEMWCYSLAYLLAGILSLVAGAQLGNVLVRRVGLAVVLLVTGKVFLLDLSRTSGLWRALSFMGLGVALVGIGWLYRRFVRLGETT